jgi:hypothetical protein
MKPSVTVLFIVVVFLSACDRTTDFKVQAYAGNRIVSAINAYKSVIGKYPTALSDLVPKYLLKHKSTGWEYRIVTNGLMISYSLSYDTGRGGVEYEPTNWFANDEGHRTIIPNNQLEARPIYPLFNIFLNLLELALMELVYSLHVCVDAIVA